MACSSTVERPALDREVVGSNPTGPINEEGPVSRTYRKHAYRWVRLVPQRLTAGYRWDKFVGDRYGNTKLRRAISKFRRADDKREIQSQLEDL